MSSARQGSGKTKSSLSLNMNKDNNSLLCLQVNLQHSKIASANLSQVLLDLDIDIALIQEPYAITNKFNNELFIPNIPNNFSIHHSLNKDHAFGAIILAKKALKAVNIAKPSTNNFIGVKLNKYPSVKFVSAYCRPSLGLNHSLKLIENFKDLKNTIIGMDSNSKNKLWNSKYTDKKGECLELFLDKHRLNVANIPISKLKYIPKKRR